MSKDKCRRNDENQITKSGPPRSLSFWFCSSFDFRHSTFGALVPPVAFASAVWHISVARRFLTGTGGLSPWMGQRMQIWPAIDLRGGKCVRLRQGDYSR